MKRYDHYKSTGITWVAEIPANWNLVALKRLVQTKITDGPHETPEFVDEEIGVPFISAEAIKDNRIDFNSKRGYIRKELDEIYSLKCKPKRNDIFIVKSGSTTGRIAMVETDINFNIWSPLALVRVNQKAEARFLYYALQSEYFQKQIQLFWSFGTQPNIGMNVIENLLVSVPFIKEQQNAVELLDKKVVEIRKLITNKQHLIQLLKEERAALIDEAITKGINPNVKLKPSGIDWLGDIPEHWEIKKLKFIAKINPSKNNLLLDANKNILVTFLPMEKVSEDGKIDCGIKKTVEELINGFTYFEKNDIIVAKITPCFENGKGALLNNLDTEIGFGSTEFHVLRAQESSLPDFIYYLTKSYFFMEIGEALMTGAAGQKRVPTDFLQNFYFAYPSLEEQEDVVHYIKTETSKIDYTISRIEKEIELMQEYKTALISEVVTGQVKVID